MGSLAGHPDLRKTVQDDNVSSPAIVEMTSRQSRKRLVVIVLNSREI